MCPAAQVVNLLTNDESRYNLLSNYRSARHGAKPFSWIVPVNPTASPWGGFFSPFCRWGKWGTAEYVVGNVAAKQEQYWPGVVWFSLLTPSMHIVCLWAHGTKGWSLVSLFIQQALRCSWCSRGDRTDSKIIFEKWQYHDSDTDIK